MPILAALLLLPPLCPTAAPVGPRCHSQARATAQAADPAAARSTAQAAPAPALGAEPDGHAALHPASASLYLRLPDVRALPQAYLDSPLARLVFDPDLAAAVERLTGGEVLMDELLAQASEQLSLDALPTELVQMGLPRAIESARSLSLSLSWPKDLEQALGSELNVLKSALTVLSAQRALGEAQAASWMVEEGEEPPPPITDLAQLGLPEPLLRDAWGNQLQLTERPTIKAWGDPGEDAEIEMVPTVISLGSDGHAGGEGQAADLVPGDSLEELVAAALGRSLLPHLGFELCLEFDQEGVAAGLLDQIAGNLPAEAPLQRRTLGSGGGEWRALTMGSDDGWGYVEIWAASDSKRLLFGGLCNRIADLEPRLTNPQGLASVASFDRARAATSPAGGQPVLEVYQTDSLWSLVGQLGELGLEQLGTQSLGELGDLPVPISVPTLDGLTRGLVEWLSGGFGPQFSRTSLVDGQFQKHRFQPDGGGQVPAMLGGSALDGSLLDRVDPEAGMVWAGGADIRRLFELLNTSLGFRPGERGDFPRALLQERGGFSIETDLIQQLEPQVAISVGLVRGLAPPSVVLTLKAKDAAKLQRGLEAWLRGLVALEPESFSLKDRPYKKLPYYELKVQPYGALPGSQAEAAEYVFGLRGDTLLISTGSKAVKDELRRETGPDSPRSPLVGNPALGEGVQELLFIDYPRYIGTLYGLVKTFGALAGGGGGGDLPFDLSQLPDADLLTRHFRPTLSVTRQSPAGRVTRCDSSFGPEIPLGGVFSALLAGFATSEEVVFPDPEGEVVEAWSEPVEAVPAPAAGDGEATREGLLRLKTLLEVYRWDRGSYPSELADLSAPSQRYPKGCLEGAPLPLDEWGRPFAYSLTSEGGFLLRSVGPNGQDEQGQGDDVRAN